MGRPVVSASFANRSLVRSLTLIVVLIEDGVYRSVDSLVYSCTDLRGGAAPTASETGQAERRSAYRTTPRANDPPAPLDGAAAAVRCTRLPIPVVRRSWSSPKGFGRTAPGTFRGGGARLNCS